MKEICKKYKAMGVHVLVLILTLFAIFASATSLNAGQAKYLYDDLGRLSQVIDETGNVATYTYDSVGNLLSITRSTGGVGAPQITGVTPATASAGTSVALTLNGNNLSGSSLKTDNPGIAVSGVKTTATSISATLTITFTARTGATTLTVSHAGGSAFTTINVNAAPPVISLLNPSSGPVSRLVTITGNGFSSTAGLNTVRFNGTLAIILSATPTRLLTAVPQGAATGPVTVAVGGLTSAGATFTVTAAAAPSPTIASISPTTGSIEGGGAITVTGSGFAADTRLYIGGNLALRLTVPDASTLKAFTPPGTLGAADVQVSNANGDALLKGGFTYLTGPPQKIIAINPAMGVATISQNTLIAVLFSRPVDRATLTSATFSLIQNSTNTAVTGTFLYDLSDTQVIFKPAGALAAGTTHTLSLTQGIKSVEGIPLEAPFIGAFTTTTGNDTISPNVSLSPANGATNVPFNSAILFTFSEPVDPTTLTSARLTVTNQGENRAGMLTLSQQNTVATFTPASPFFPNTTVGVVLSGLVADAAGNRLVGSSGVGTNLVSGFTTATTADRVPPVLLGISPPNGATGINTNAAITLTFNESLDPATITASTFSVSSGGLNRPGRFLLTNFNSVITYIPDQPYPAFSQVTLTVAPGLADVSGNSILSATTSTFTTQSGQDNFQPSVISMGPAGINVALNSKVTLVFSERINPITVTSTTFAIHTNRFIGKLSGTITVAPDQRSATFTPSLPLLPNETYYITYTTGITDLVGNPLFNPEPAFGSSFFNSSKTFRTGARLSDTQGPTVLEISPGNGANGVPTNAQMLLRFSEPVAPPTLTPQTIVVAAGGIPVDTEVSLEQDNTVARIRVANLLTWEPNRFYDVTVTTGVHDMADNPLSAPFISGFTTSAGTDTIAPTATVSPTNGMTVSPTTMIAFAFNEVINPISMTSGSIFVSGGGITGAARGQVMISPDRKGITFQPEGPLPAGQVFSMSISGIEDLAGNRITPFSSTFTTSLAPGTNQSALPLSATVIVNPAQVFADGQSLATVTLSNITDNSGALVPNGTKIAVTALPAFNLFSGGGTILEGIPSSADARFKIVTTFGGRATVTYKSSNHPELLPSQTLQTIVQVASVDNAENPVRLIGQGSAVLFRHSSAVISTNPFSLLANGTSYAQVDVSVTGFNGRPVPEGQRIGITTDPVFVASSIAGTLSGGGPAVDPRFKIFTTNREGEINLTYTPPSLGATETGTAIVQAVEVDDLGNVVTYLGSQNIFLSGSSGAVAPQPKIISVSPLQGYMGVGTNAPVVIGFNESLDTATVTSSSVRLLGPSSVSVPGTLTFSSGGGGTDSVVTFIPAALLAPNATYTIFVDSTIRSAAGIRLLTSSTTTFSTGSTTDTLAPTVLLVNPFDGAAGVGINAVVMAKFSEGVNSATLHSGSVTLSSGATSILATLTITSETQTGRTLLTLTPQQFLVPNTVYTLTLASAITDTAGNALSAPVITTFTTQAGADTLQPSVAVVTPSGGNVPLNARITIVFSEPINPITVTSQTFYMNSVSGVITVAPDLRSATLTPDHPLAPNTTYSFNFLAGISDISGNPLFNPTGPFHFGQFNPRFFTTGAQFSDTVGPTVLEISPVNGATGVPINAQVVIRFSEPLSAVSVTPQTIVVTAGGVPVETEVSLDPFNDAVVRLKVANLLTWTASTTHDITVTTGIRDVADNPPANAVVSQFTTGTGADTTRPTVLSVDPPPSGILARTGSILITFSEPIALPSILSHAISVTGGGINGAIPGTVTFSADRTILTFTPNAPFFVGAFYSLSIGSIEDLAQNRISGFNSSFKVELTPGSDPTTLPTSAVVLNSGSLLADGQSTTTLTITGISRNGILVPDGTKVAITAAPAYRVDSAGGTILGGVGSADPRFRIFTVLGGQVTVTYQSVSLPNLSSEFSRAFSYIQVASVDVADAPASLIGAGFVELFRGTRIINPLVNPNTLLANGTSYSVATLTLLGANGNPFPPGVLIGATADSVYFSTGGGTLSGGVPAPDPRFRLYSTIRGGTVEIIYTAPSLAAGQTASGSIQVVEVDGQGTAVRLLTILNIALSGTSGFTSPQPVVTAVSPAHGQSQVAINSRVVVAFDQSLDPATVTPGSFNLAGPNSVAVSGTRTVSAGPAGPNSIVTFSPDVPLALNSSFTLFVSALIKSASGTPLLPSQAVTFSTGTGTDSTAPTVVSFSPPSGFTGVPTNAVVMIEFSEIMNATTLNSMTLTLTTGGNAVAARVAVIHDFSRMRSTVTLAPEQLLLGNATFTASLTGVSDTAGNMLASPLTFSFTTGGGSDTIAPSALTVSPAQGTSGVPLNAKASVVFSEPINPASLNDSSFYLGWDFGKVPASISVAPDLLSATLIPDQPLLANTRYYTVYTNKIADLAGNALANPTNPISINMFTTGTLANDSVPPSLVAVTPANGATGVPTNAVILLQLSEPLAAANVNPSTVTFSTGGTPIQGIVTLEQGTFIKFRPLSAGGLQAGSTYTISVSTGVTDLAANPLTASILSSFTVGSQADTTAPTVVSFSPSNNATNVPTTASIVVTFSEPINPASVNLSNGAVRLIGGGVSGPISGNVSFSPDNMTLTFTPTFPLFAGQFHFFQLSGIEDRVGIRLAAGINSTFMTGFAAGTDSTTLPTSGIVVSNPNILLADGLSTTTITITGISRNGILIPDGTKVAITAAPAYFSSAGGTILGGLTSAADPRFQIFTVLGGQVTVAYRSISLPNLSSDFSRAFAYIQVAAADASDAPGTLIGVGTVTLFRGTRVINQQVNPTTLLANGTSYSVATLTLLDANGNPFPPGVLIGATADPVYVSSAAGGTLSGGLPAPDPRFRLYSTIRGGTIEITYTAPSLAAGQTAIGYIQIAEVDGPGNPVRLLTTLSTALSGTSGFTSPQPVVTAISPAHGQIQVAVNSPVVVAFSQSLDPATVTPNTFYLAEPSSVRVSGTRTLSDGPAGPNSIVTFTPDVPLMPNKSFYTVVINSSIKGASGVPLLFSQSASFSTGTGRDTTPPMVALANPSGVATSVPTNVLIMVQFSERMNATTLHSGTLSLISASGPISGRVQVSTDPQNSMTIATFVPDQFLPGNASYTLTAAGMTDTAGNPISGPISLSFSTQSALDTTHPSVAGFSPPNGSIDVPATIAISVTFNEPVNPVSVNSSTLFLSGPTIVKSLYSFSNGNTTVTLTPTAPLAANGLYTIIASSSILDVAGNNLFTSSSSSFRVALSPGTTNLPTAATVTINPQQFFSNGQIATTVTISNINRNGIPVPNGTIVAVTADPVFTGSIGGILSGSSIGTSTDPRFLLFSTFGASVTFSYTPPDVTDLPPNISAGGAVQVASVDLDNRPISMIGSNLVTLSGIRDTLTVSSPTTLIANGTSTSTLTVTVKDFKGDLVPNGTRVGLTVANIFIQDSAGGSILGGSTSAADPRVQIFTTSAGQITATYQSPTARGTGSATVQVVTVDANGNPTGLAGSVRITLQ